ncbi:MAG: leucine-rich repeat domain-containing protein [Lachnospiraceae bacterium]|nr:leucine-rich repeat domain-containing protein [Lachnospiraceae bacterium]
MKKKMMAVLLALTLTAGTMTPLGVSAEEQPEVSTEHVEIQEQGAGVYTGTCGEGAEYTLDENGTLTITGNGSIDFGAFRGFGKEDDKRVIKKVVISSGMIGIGNFAFENCSDLKSVEIPASVTSIGSAAFKDCSGLESMNIDEANTTYENPEGSNAIVEKSSKTLVAGCKNTKIPDDVKIIGAYAFCGCSDLKSIEIPDNVSEIQVAAFDDCSNLTAIHIPAGVDKIALGVFMGCSNLNSITIDSANRSYESPGNANAIIDKGTMTLLEGSNNTVIPEGVKVIWQNAFAERIHLKSITIPASVTSIVRMPFSDCDSLEEIKVDADNAIFDSRNNCNAIIESATNTLIAGCGKTVIPEGIETIGDSAFERVKTLTHVTIPKSVTEIRGYAFERCENLSTVNLQKGIQTIGYGAFTECVGLTNLIFCGTKADWQAVTIDEDGREELESVLKYHELVKKEKVPATCGKDGSEEYWTCSICDQVYLSADMTQNPQELTAPIAIPATGNHSWDNGVVTEKATTAKEGIKTYTCTVCKATKTEKIAKLKPTNSSTVKKGTKVTIKGYKYTVKNSSEVTFTGIKNKKASKISIPTTVKIKNKKYKVTAMSEKSLKGVKAKTIIVGNNVQTIGNSAMENCKQLTKVTLGKNVKKIGKNVFKSDKKLKNITIKSTKLKSVGKNAFKGINSKAKITVPKKKYTSYKKLMKGKGQGKKVKIVKAK